MRPSRPPKTFSAGFSLIELTVVLLIIGILAKIAVTSYRTSVETARLSEAMANLNAAAGQLESLFAQNNAWPATWNGFTANPNFTFSYPNSTPTTITATRSGGSVFDGNVMTLQRQSPGVWCWKWSSPNNSITANQTPMPANRFCP